MKRKIKSENYFIRNLIGIAIIIMVAFSCTGCEIEESPSTSKGTTKQDVQNTIDIGNKLVSAQPTPTDIDYSLERYNLIKRAYWVNGMRDKARALPSPIADMPLGYIVLLTDNGAVVGKFIVDGKVTSLNSYLTPDSEYYEKQTCDSGSGIKCTNNKWLPDVDGSYGENDKGIFFFTTDGKYIEWTGTYLYSDIPFEVSNPIVKVGK